MEEEGTAVYFEASPAAEELKGNHESSELIFVGDHHLSELHSTQEDTAERDSKWMFSTLYHKCLASLYVQESKYVERAISDIKNSSLLTEEDYQLLYYTITEPTDNKDQTDHERRSKRFSYVLISSVIVAVLACVAAVSSKLMMIMATIVVILAGTLKLVRVRSERCLKQGLTTLSAYSSNTEALLSLMTQILRIIQEMEIISHGYSRPSRSVPISRVERQQGGSYQCPVLRRRLFKTCQEGILLLRKCAQLLCKEYPLNEELDTVHSYLAFTPLQELHQYLHEEMDEVAVLPQSDQAEKMPYLALDSLKDACSLLAVQNSEVLRRMALNLAFGSKKNPQTSSSWTCLHHALKKSEELASGCDCTEFKLWHLSQLLKDPLQFVLGACEELEWSLEFHRNHMFGEPPSRIVGKSQLKQHPLQPVMDEVHCMDLKTQVALQRIRELSSLLTLEDDSEEEDSQIEILRDHLVSIQRDIEGVRDVISDSIQNLDKLCKPQSSKGLNSPHPSVKEEGDTSDAEEFEEPIGNENEGSSDEEMVFEAYIPPQVETSETESFATDRLTEEERKELQELQREVREVPVKMMKELRSVLSVRSIEKQKKREEKRRKKGHSLQTPENSKQQHIRKNEIPLQLQPCDVDSDTMKQATKVMDDNIHPVKEDDYKAVTIPVTTGPCSETTTTGDFHDQTSEFSSSPSENFIGSPVLTGTVYKWQQSPQLAGLAQAIMAASAAVPSKGSVEVFGDSSDDD